MKYEVLPNSCRICLRKCKKLRSIYKGEEGNITPIEMLKLITGMIAEEDVDADEWPKNICKSCELSLNLAFQFRSKALKSQRIIEFYYNHQRFRDDDDSGTDPFLNENKATNITDVIKEVENSKPKESTETTSTTEEATVNNYSEMKIEDLETPFSDSARFEYLIDATLDDEFDAIDSSADEKRLSIFQQEKQQFVSRDNNEDDNVDADSVTIKKKDNNKKLCEELHSIEKLLEAKEQKFKSDAKSLQALNNVKKKRDKHGRKHKYGNEELKQRCIASKQNTLLKMDNKELNIAPPTIKLLTKKSGRPKINDESGHICDICGNIYAKRGRMMEHRRRHDKELRFACEVCDKRFHLREKLRKHMFSHSGRKPYPCSFCSRTFFYESVKKAHEAVHKGVKPYVCEVCQKAFAYSHALKKHKLIHADIKLYHCVYCDKDFRLQHHMKQHEETKLHQNAVKLMETASDADAL